MIFVFVLKLFDEVNNNLCEGGDLMGCFVGVVLRIFYFYNLFVIVYFDSKEILKRYLYLDEWNNVNVGEIGIEVFLVLRWFFVKIGIEVVVFWF